MDLGHWICDIPIELESFGFIYEIVNNVSGKIYIGKKQFEFRRKKKLRKNKKNRQIKVTESDWKTYTGSNKDLNADIAKLGKNYFTFRIIKFCNGKWDLTYSEIREQILRDVLLSDNYYNGIINCRLGRVKTKSKDIE